MSAADLLDFSAEVAEARASKKPIVALESTIITHGMPYPRNVETARSVEEAAREMGPCRRRSPSSTGASA